MTTYTVKQEGKVYDARGIAGMSLPVGTALTVVSPKMVSIPARGDCYQISAPVAGYFLADRVREVGDVPPPPPPTVNEYILHVKDGVTRKFIPE